MGPVHRLQVFALEDTTIQVTWPALPAGPVTLRAGGTATTVEGGPHPGAVVLDGLAPATTYDIDLHAAGRPPRRLARVRTLASPPGRLLSRVATISDTHLGERGFGYLFKLREPGDGREPYPLRCLRAAANEAVAWGADVLVVKGDLTDQGRAVDFERAAAVLGDLPVPVHVVPGNHDRRRRSVDPAAILAARGVEYSDGSTAVDLPGLTLVVADSTLPGSSFGRLPGGDGQHLVKLAAAAAPGPVLLAMHHYLMRTERPVRWPPGIPVQLARPFLDQLAEANPATFVTSGHTHSHRRRHHGPLVLTQVGSTKDYPGTWAGYAVHEGGIRQVVRRVAAPDCIEWTERTARAAGGLWGLWGPGRRADRCFTHVWPDQSPEAGRSR